MALLTAPLRRELSRALRDRPFGVRFWDGTSLPASELPAATFELRSPRAVAQVLRAPGRLGLGRAYVEGSLGADDLDGAFAVVDAWTPPPLGRAARLRLLGAALVSAAASPLARRPALELVLRGERHSRERDAAAVRYHYDVGNEFFALFLDRSMTYSCAYWKSGAATLEEAQEAKLELVCKKLALHEGERILDVGCGWGSFVIHAARHHGVSAVGITLAEEQARLARERVGSTSGAAGAALRFMPHASAARRSSV